MQHTMRQTIHLGDWLPPKRSRRRVPIPLILLFLLWPAGDADAVFEGALRGEYNLTVNRHCVVGSAFDANFEASSPTPGFDAVFRGTTTYNGTGGGTYVGEGLVVNQTFSTVNRANLNCTVTYTVNPDGSITQTMNCDLTFTVGGPAPSPGQTATLIGIGLDGRLSLDGTVLLVNDTAPSVETFTVTSGTNIGFTNQRVCNSGGTATSRR